MRYVTLGIVVAGASALMLSLAPLKAQVIDSQGPIRQNGMCLNRGDLEGQNTYLAPCPAPKKGAAVTRASKRRAGGGAEGGGGGGGGE
jgi:hypothetical protein